MHQLLDRDLQLFDEQLEAELRSDPALLGDIGASLIHAGGKRIRPRLALLTARLLGAREEHGFAVAMAVEMLHTASLLHDDLIDESDTRRGQLAAHRRFSNSISVMAGDFLLARVLRVLARTGNHDFTMLMSDAAAVIVEAEILQYQLAESEEHSFDSYLRVIDGKTAVLISTALEGVAVLADAPAGTRAALREFGLRYGRAFQLQDDYLDLFATEQELGKPVGNDLREGKATWPVLLLLESGSSEAAAILARRAAEPGDVTRMVGLIRESGAAAATLDRVNEEARLARAALTAFPESDARSQLMELAAVENERAA